MTLNGVMALIMVALCNRADHYIFALLFLSIYLLLLFFISRLISCHVYGKHQFTSPIERNITALRNWTRV